MRIVNIIQGTNLGGMEQASLRLMLGLKERGHSCEVISLNPIGGLGPLLKEHDIPVTGLPYLGKGGWRSCLRLRNALHSTKADALLMTGQNLFAMFTLGTFCRGRRLLAIHFHHTGVKPLWQWRLIYRVAYRRFGTITFPSDFVRAEAQMIYPKIASLSHTVRNPLQIPEIPSAEEREQARCALGIPKGALVVGNAGWLIPRKRFDIFLQVAEKIGEKVPNAFFIIAGDGPERSRLEALAERLGIKRRVKWLGWQSDLGRFYRSIDVMVFNSDWDAMGLSPLESMAFGIPVVASVVNGGLAEIIDKPEVGYLFKEHNVESLAAVAAMLLQNPFERHAVGLAGRERVAAISDIRAAACWHEQALASGFSTKDDEKL